MSKKRTQLYLTITSSTVSGQINRNGGVPHTPQIFRTGTLVSYSVLLYTQNNPFLVVSYSLYMGNSQHIVSFIDRAMITFKISEQDITFITGTIERVDKQGFKF